MDQPKMKNLQTKLLAVVTLIILVTTYVALETRSYEKSYLLSAKSKDKIRALFDQKTPYRKCFNHYNKILKNPDASYIAEQDTTNRSILDYSSSRSVSDALKEHFKDRPIGMGWEEEVSVKIRSTNSYGAYISQTFYCPLVKGRFDEFALQNYLKKLKSKSSE